MDRRLFLTGSAASAAALPATAQVARGSAVNVVTAFGFVPDGKTCNYDAFHRLAKAANARGGGRYRFPPGDYYVARYRTTKAYQRPEYRAAAPKDVTNSTFSRCNGLELIGAGARIRLNGKFTRHARLNSEGVMLGLLEGIFMPFEFSNCQNVTISGFDMDGGVRDMRKEAGVTEAYAYLIALHACRNVTLRDLHLHHCQTDAILLHDNAMLDGARGVACRDVRIERVRCINNARGGLAPLQVYGLICTDSAFNGSAFGTGSYGHHAPGFGVDVEPDHKRPEQVDIKTGNLHFERCEFMDNGSAFLAAYTDSFQGYLRIIDCNSRNGNNTPNPIIICWPGALLKQGGALLQGGQHDLGNGTFWTGWSGEYGGDLIVRNASFSGDGPYGIFHAHENNRVTLDGITLIGRHRKGGAGAFPAIEAPPAKGQRNIVRNSRFFLAAGRKSAQPLNEPVASFNHVDCSGNRFETDLPAMGGQQFVIYYHPQARVSGDRFKGMAPGLRDTIMPSGGPVDTRTPFSRR
jgi:hypothetical protein